MEGRDKGYILIVKSRPLQRNIILNLITSSRANQEMYQWASMRLFDNILYLCLTLDFNNLFPKS